jgi:hypothetical protein
MIKHSCFISTKNDIIKKLSQKKGEKMRKILILGVVAALPFAANAADFDVVQTAIETCEQIAVGGNGDTLFRCQATGELSNIAGKTPDTKFMSAAISADMKQEGTILINVIPQDPGRFGADSGCYRIMGANIDIANLPEEMWSVQVCGAPAAESAPAAAESAPAVVESAPAVESAPEAPAAEITPAAPAAAESAPAVTENATAAE